MRTIASAKETDFGAIATVLSSSCIAANLPEPKDLLQAIPGYLSAGRVYVSKDGPQILAFAIVEPDIASLFYPSTHSFSKTSDVLDAMEQPEGNVVGLVAIYVDGRMRHQGVGKELLRALLARYKGFGWVTLLDGKNLETIQFFKGRAFICLPGDYLLETPNKQEANIWAKPHRPTGICREGNW